MLEHVVLTLRQSIGVGIGATSETGRFYQSGNFKFSLMLQRELDICMDVGNVATNEAYE